MFAALQPGDVMFLRHASEHVNVQAYLGLIPDIWELTVTNRRTIQLHLHTHTCHPKRVAPLRIQVLVLREPPEQKEQPDVPI
jgi:hypothetical protein